MAKRIQDAQATQRVKSPPRVTGIDFQRIRFVFVGSWQAQSKLQS
jgi:hypothetical protein